MPNIAPRIITELKQNEVFVFGSNAKGIHGAGAALTAFGHKYHRELKLSRWDGRPFKGKWAVYGIARGFQVGYEGMSYAIETKADWRVARSTPLREIGVQCVQMFVFAEKHPEYKFLCTDFGAGKAGYSSKEISRSFYWGQIGCIIPDNVYLPPTWVD